MSSTQFRIPIAHLDGRTGQYAPAFQYADGRIETFSPTSFDETRALQIAQDMLDQPFKLPIHIPPPEPKVTLHSRAAGLPVASGRGAAEWERGCREMEDRVDLYIKALKDGGFKAAMPNDGWVNWDTKELHFAYPWFHDKPQVGDMVALGSVYDQYTHYVRLAARPSVNRSMLTYLPFDHVCRVESQSLLPLEQRTDCYKHSAGMPDMGCLFVAGILIAVLYAVTQLA